MNETIVKNRKKPLRIVLIVLLALVVVFSIASFIIVKVCFDDVFSRTAQDAYSEYLRYSDVADEYPRELLSFNSGENKLQGYLYGADSSKGLVVVCHGLGGGAENYLDVTLEFVDAGYMVFAYDNTGCYNSEGKNCIGLSQSVIDLDAALTFIESESRFDGLPVLLYGHSWGGYAVTAIFNYDHEIAGSAAVAGFNKPMQMIIEWARGMMGGFAYVEYPYIWLYQKGIFGDKLETTAVDGLNRVDTPVLIIHGTADATIGFDESAIIAYRDEITNPNVQYKICTNERQNGHNNLFVSTESLDYLEELNAAYDVIYEQYNKEVPEDVRVDFFAKIDKRRTSKIDSEFLADVLAFYENAIK